MIRITETSNEQTVTLRLDGKVVDAWVSDLEKLCLKYRDKENKAVILDFSGVTFIDDRGVSMLEKIKDERINIINCSLFVELLLRDLINDSREGK